jgi:hypothetical protein
VERLCAEHEAGGYCPRFQSGVVNGYVTWTVLGLACLGAVLGLTIR